MRKQIDRRAFLGSMILNSAALFLLGCQKDAREVERAEMPPKQDEWATQPPPSTPDKDEPPGEKPTTMPVEQELLHFIPDQGVAGDAHPFFENGTCYLFYLDEKYNSKLVTSTDLVHWQPRTITHTPPGGDHPYAIPYFVLGVWKHEDTGLYRTYHGGPNNMMIGNISYDLLNWDYAPKETIIWGQDRYRMQRDPVLFWNEDEQKYWVTMTCEVNGVSELQSGGIGFASSTDLTNWEKRGDLLYPGNNRSMECPQMFKLGNQWYLFASIFEKGHVGKLSYWISEQCTGPWQQLNPPSLDGEDLCAANMGWNGENWIMFGWIPLLDGPAHGTYVWGGHIGFPREIYQLADKSLGTRLERSFANSIRGELIFNSNKDRVVPRIGNWRADSPKWVLENGYGLAQLDGLFSRYDLTLTVSLESPTGYGGVRIAGPDGKNRVEVVVDHSSGKLMVRNDYEEGHGTPYAKIELASNEVNYSMRVIVEADMVELFVNDRYSLAARIPVKMPEQTISLVGKGGNISFDQLEVYRLKSPGEIA